MSNTDLIRTLQHAAEQALNAIDDTQTPEARLALLRQAKALYHQIYRLRKAGFHPTHIGLGTWGQYEYTQAQKERIKALTKERAKVYAKARRLQKRGK